ncbi:MAG: glycosyltransferase family 39 protein, partial [Acidobacteria bacterium]|nr:glycosyltransferase family 39 protein [Acidobacteriota bacterium]
MPASEGSPQRRRIPETALLIVLLALTLVLPVALMRRKSATFDEVAHLPAGYSYLTTGLFKINPQHPPLIKEICALPLLFMDLKMPVDKNTLERSNVPLTYQWGFGHRFLYSQDADRILFAGRIMAVGLSLGLAILIVCWSARLWGIPGALLAVALYLLDPTITAHAQLVATDVGLAFFATLFLWMLRRYVDEPNRMRLALAGITLGLALGAKFSAVILVPIALVLLLLAGYAAPSHAEPAKPSPSTSRKAKGSAKGAPGAAGRAPRRFSPLMSLAIMLVLAALVVWALYFFPSDPWFYLRGLATVNRDHDPGYFAYLMGEMRPGRWYSYFLIAYLVKTPIPSLILLAAAGVVFFRRRRASLLDEAFLLIPALAFFVGYSLTADNLGVRY